MSYGIGSDDPQKYIFNKLTSIASSDHERIFLVMDSFPVGGHYWWLVELDNESDRAHNHVLVRGFNHKVQQAERRHRLSWIGTIHTHPDPSHTDRLSWRPSLRDFSSARDKLNGVYQPERRILTWYIDTRVTWRGVLPRPKFKARNV